MTEWYVLAKAMIGLIVLVAIFKWCTEPGTRWFQGYERHDEE